tara:strand:+ start:1225 stop:1440 length:216 start_codon:yes stop_codon:yes gene_type:complete
MSVLVLARRSGHAAANISDILLLSFSGSGLRSVFAATIHQIKLFSGSSKAAEVRLFCGHGPKRDISSNGRG